MLCWAQDDNFHVAMSLASIYAGLQPPRRRDQQGSNPGVAAQDAVSGTREGTCSAHSVRVQLGLLRGALSRTAKAQHALDDPRLNLTRTIFGSWHHRATSGSVVGRTQACVAFASNTGDADCFDFQIKKGQTIARMKAIGLFSHVDGQQRQLHDWLVRARGRHAIATFHAQFKARLSRCTASTIQ